MLIQSNLFRFGISPSHGLLVAGSIEETSSFPHLLAIESQICDFPESVVFEKRVFTWKRIWVGHGRMFPITDYGKICYEKCPDYCLFVVFADVGFGGEIASEHCVYFYG